MTHELKPIRTRAEHSAALVEIEALWGAAPRTPAGDRLDVLVTLVEAYEAKHFKIDFPDPIAAIEFRMEQAGLKRVDLEPLLGSRGRVAEVLNRKRGLSIDMIRKLNEELGISADVLIQPTVEGVSRPKTGAPSIRSSTMVMSSRGDDRRVAARKAARHVSRK